MKHRRLAQWGTLLLFASFILMTPMVKAALFIPSITIQIPEGSAFEPGQALEITWNISHEGSLQRRPVFIYLTDKNSRQRRIVAVVSNDQNGYSWTIPEDLKSSTYKLIFSTRVNGKIARRFSRYFMINPIVPMEGPMEGPIEEPAEEVIDFPDVSAPEVVRKSVPFFELSGASERTLVNGQNTVYELKVNADENGSLALGRLVFNVYQAGLTSVDNVQIYKGSTRLTPGTASDSGRVYLMWDAGAGSCFASERQGGAGTGMDCNGNVTGSSKLIVTFTREQHFSSTQTFKIKMDVSGTTTGSYLSLRLDDGDDSAEANIGGTVSNTGQIYNGTGINELFANADDYVTEATTITDRNIIWSDLSAIPHRYPTFTAGASPTISATSSEDFTNGYLLKVGALPSVTLK